jgi:HK97 family phage major capsid protein
METITKTATRMQIEQVTLTAHSLFGLSFASEELLADSPVSFAAILAAGFSDQFTYHMINERLNGTGVGEPMGIMNSPCLVSIVKETDQPATTIRFPNIVKMRARAWGYQDAIWMANHDCIPQLMQMNVEVGVGGAPVWQPSAVPDHPDMLLGRPIIFTEYAQTLGTAGDIVLANWKEYLEGVLQPLQSAESIHVRFDAHERVFKFWLRNAGAPWWRSALTPKNSTDTLSPFVVLAVRA